MSEQTLTNLRGTLALFAVVGLFLAVLKVIFIIVKAVLRHFGREWDDSGFWRGVWDFVRYGFMPREDEEKKDENRPGGPGSAY